MPWRLPDLGVKGLWGAGSEDIWLTGYHDWCHAPECECTGAILRFTAGDWSFVDVPCVTAYFGIWGASADDIWVVGSDSISYPEYQSESSIFHWDGSAWSKIVTLPDLDLDAIWGTSPEDIWSTGPYRIGVHWNGATWKQWELGSLEAATGAARNLWGSRPDDYWATGSGGQLLHFDGSEWRSLRRRIDNGGLNDIWGSSVDNIWAVGGQGSQWNPPTRANTFHFDGRTWAAVDNPGCWDLDAIWGSSADDAWAIGYDNDAERSFVMRWDGEAWTMSRDDFDRILRDVEGTSTGEAWLVGTGLADDGVLALSTLYRFDSGQWSVAEELEGVVLTSLHWTDSGHLWVGGWEQSSGHDLVGRLAEGVWQSWTWELIGHFNGLWGRSDEDLWAYGGQYAPDGETRLALLLHFDGQDWQEVTLDPGIGFLYSMWGSSPDDIWAVGERVILHYDGTGWELAARGTGGNNYGIWGFDAENIWMVGTGGSILRYQP